MKKGQSNPAATMRAAADTFTDPPYRPRAKPSAFRRFLANLGLQGKLSMAFSLLLLIGLSVCSWLFVSQSRDTLSDILGEQARQISQTLAMAAEAPYLVNDVDHLERLGKDLLKSRNMVLVVFYDAVGKPLAVACRDPEYNLKDWQGAPDSQSNIQNLMRVREQKTASLGSFLVVTAPVFDIIHSTDPQGHHRPPETPPRLLGYLTVGISQNHEQIQLQRVSILGAAVGCSVFILSLPLALGLVHRIFLPIRQLVAATNRIAGGDYDAHVATHRPDEIGMLARSFNEMVKRIRQHQQELQIANQNLAEANRDLEAKVLQRTAELEKSNHRLSAEIAEKEDFLRAVSHDLSAPLRNISGMATMLLMKHREGFDKDIIHRLERIRKNVEVETDLIGELLELSRIKTRRQKMESVDVAALVRELAELFEDELKRKQIALVVSDLLPHITCEKARLRQVFQNLIDNAIKYMGDNPVREIEIGHHIRQNEAEFYVRDTGLGIHPDDLQRVFYIFRRGRNAAEVHVPGKGIGLASVKSIIETYDGRIWVESEADRGSVFRFTIHGKFLAASEHFPSLDADYESAAAD